MNILSKELLYKPSTPSTPTYEAYYVHNGSLTSLGDVVDLSKTFAAQDEFIGSNMFVYEGDLYQSGIKVRTSGNITSLTGRTTSSNYLGYFIEEGKCYYYNSSMNISQVGSANDWISICGYGSANSSAFSSTYRAFGDASDGLWMVRISAQSPKLSSLSGWTKITGYGNSSSANHYGYGIHSGELYYLYANGNGAIQQGSDTTWTDITGSHESANWYGYGINDGKLYALDGVPSQIGVDTNWTRVSGTAKSDGTAYALGLNGGKLYKIAGTGATQIGNSADWKSCSGFAYTNDEMALAYDSTALYGISADSTITKLMDGKFVYCGGNYNNGNAYGVVIRRK